MQRELIHRIQRYEAAFRTQVKREAARPLQPENTNQMEYSGKARDGNAL